MYLRLQPHVGIRPLRDRLRTQFYATRSLCFFKELRKRLVWFLFRRPKMNKHPIGERKQHHHQERNAQKPQQFFRLFFSCDMLPIHSSSAILVNALQPSSHHAHFRHSTDPSTTPVRWRSDHIRPFSLPPFLQRLLMSHVLFQHHQHNLV